MALIGMIWAQTSKTAIIVIFSVSIYGWVMRGLSGSFIDPQAWFVVAFIDGMESRGWMNPHYGPGHPKRMGQFMGAIMTIAALVLYLLDYYEISAWILFSLYAVVVNLLVWNFCAACGMFYILMTLNLLSDDVCRACKVKYEVGGDDVEAGGSAHSLDRHSGSKVSQEETPCNKQVLDL